MEIVDCIILIVTLILVTYILGNYFYYIIKKDKVFPRKYKSINGKKYYFKREDAERARKSGQRIYYTKGLGYYIVTPKKRSIWR